MASIRSLRSLDSQLVLLDCQVGEKGVVVGLMAIAAPLRFQLKSEHYMTIPLYLEFQPDTPEFAIALPNIYHGSTNGFLTDITLFKVL